MFKSLKVKFVFVLIFVVSMSLLIQFYISFQEFSRDKVAYVFDAMMERSQATSVQLQSDIESTIDSLRVILQQTNQQGKKSGILEQGKGPSGGRARLLHVAVVRWDGAQFRLVQVLSDNSQQVIGRDRLKDPSLKRLLDHALAKGISLKKIDESSDQWWLAARLQDRAQGESFVLAQLEGGYFTQSFLGDSLQDNFLLNAEGKVLFFPAQVGVGLTLQQVQTLFSESFRQLNSSNEVKRSVVGDRKFLLARAGVPLGGLQLFSIVDEAEALRGVKLMTIKSIFILGLLIGLAIVFAVFGANTLTKNLQQLSQGMRHIGQGDFSFRVFFDSKDEIGQLADGFNIMSQKVVSLMKETEQKGRMETELKTARTVQMMLFPEAQAKGENYRIEGFYEPASECGGDWWYYGEKQSKLLMWIGDATGHGVAAALLTSAVRSASAILEKQDPIDLQRIASDLNRAIHSVSKGQLMMTFFLASLDLNTGQFEFVNASHEWPVVIPNSDQALDRRDLNFLLSEGRPGARFGQELESEYKIERATLKPGDRLFIFTDGVSELNNEKGKQLGERNMFNSLAEACNDSSDLGDIKDHFAASLRKFQGKAELADDVTFFFLQWKSPSKIDA